MIIAISFRLAAILISHLASASLISVKNITTLGSQLTPDVTHVSRDGGYSALINGKIVFFYDDTECMDLEGNQLSFVSNTAAYASDPKKDIRSVQDFGVVNVGVDRNGSPKRAILADSTVETGGWIPFIEDELTFNQQKKGKERVAIWPGTSPTSISTIQAFLFAPLVYVDSRPQDPSKEYQARGMTLITIDAPAAGPVAIRRGDLIIPGTEIAFGGFSTLLGRQSVTTSAGNDNGSPDVYLIGMTDGGLQLARVGIDHIKTFNRYTFWRPGKGFTNTPPSLKTSDPSQMYLPGTYSSGSVFYSPYFGTFLMIYFNKMTDSNFYIRYLDLESVQDDSQVWTKGGRNGQGIVPEDVEALVVYNWSDEQKLYASPPGLGGFNYAGVAHPEYFNRQYFAPTLYPSRTAAKDKQNDWYGGGVVAEDKAGGNGKHLLLSWTSQKVGGKDAGIYDIEFAVVEFGNVTNGFITPNPTSTSTTATAAAQSPTSTSHTTSEGEADRVVNAARWSILLQAVFFLLIWLGERKFVVLL